MSGVPIGYEEIVASAVDLEIATTYDDTKTCHADCLAGWALFMRSAELTLPETYTDALAEYELLLEI